MTIVTEAFSMSIQYVVESWPLGSVWSHTQTQRIEPVPHFCIVKETKCTPVMNCLCYSAPGAPHLKYDPEPNTYSKNWPTVRRPQACFPLRKSTKATPRSSDTPLHACGIV